MNTLTRPDRILTTLQKLNGKLLAPAIFLFGLVATLVTYQSIFGIQPPPIELINLSGTAYAGGPNLTLIDYKRQIQVSSSVKIVMGRTVECGELTYDLPTSFREKVNGVYTLNDRLILPFRVPAGTACSMFTLIQYRPTFSLRTHSYYAPVLRFEVEKLEPKNYDFRPFEGTL